MREHVGRRNTRTNRGRGQKDSLPGEGVGNNHERRFKIVFNFRCFCTNALHIELSAFIADRHMAVYAGRPRR